MSDVPEKKPVDERRSDDKVLKLFDEMKAVADYLVRMYGSDVQSAQEGLGRREIRDCMIQHALAQAIWNLIAQAREQYVSNKEKGWKDKTLDAQIAAMRSPFASVPKETKAS